MDDIAIQVDRLGKVYRIGGPGASNASFREALMGVPRAASDWVRRLSSGAAPGAGTELFWALREVSFEARKGQVLGVIGRNGAGKSTLLKILSRITEPTEGRATLHGRIGALLEVGTGFHPELTGKENIYLSGAILGMRKAEIDRKFDDIVAFAEIERFLYTPVKRYSSGMYVRLGFAVAAHLEPEILLVDEVLAVGDASFQKRCLGKMDEVAGSGRTVLFVSHNLQTISTLTSKCLVIDQGRVAFWGDTRSALAKYRSLWTEQGSQEYVRETEGTGLSVCRVVTSDPGQIHRFGEPLRFEFELTLKEKPGSGAFSFQVVDEEERPVAHLWLLDSEARWSKPGRVRLSCVVQSPKLYMGRYALRTYLADRSSGALLEALQGICPFEVVMEGTPREYDWAPGACAYIETGEWRVG